MVSHSKRRIAVPLAGLQVRVRLAYSINAAPRPKVRHPRTNSTKPRRRRRDRNAGPSVSDTVHVSGRNRYSYLVYALARALSGRGRASRSDAEALESLDASHKCHLVALRCTGRAARRAYWHRGPSAANRPLSDRRCLGRREGWPALEQRLLAHERYGPPIRRWRERGLVPRKAKILASTMMLASAILLQFTPVAQWLRVGAPVTMFIVAVWLWRRPEV